MIWSKSIFVLKVYSIHYILRKNTNDQKNYRQNKCYIKCTLFCSQAPTHHSFFFNLWFLYQLKNKVHYFSESLGGIFHFWFSLVFTKVYIFIQQKVWTLWTLNGASTRNCESVEKEKFVMKIFFQAILNKVLKSFQKWYLLI